MLLHFLGDLQSSLVDFGWMLSVAVVLVRPRKTCPLFLSGVQFVVSFP